MSFYSWALAYEDMGVTSDDFRPYRIKIRCCPLQLKPLAMPVLLTSQQWHQAIEITYKALELLA
ncbi:MAG: hypothetical protein ACO1RA_16010 [Planctomycetaceae bacterium]